MIGYGCLKPLIFLEERESSTLKPCEQKMRETGITYLEVDDDEGHDDGCEKVAKVWRVLSIDSLLDTIELVWLSQEEMEKSYDSALEFGSLVGSNGDWGEGFPQDSLADVGGNEKGDT